MTPKKPQVETPALPEAAPSPGADLRVVSRGADVADVAALTAVLTAALDELAAALERDDGARLSAWQRSQRAVRATITPSAGAWRSFSG